MKLLNCITFRIEDFFGSSNLKPYAILSHRWEADEVTYQEVLNPEELEQKTGWVKIREACRIALSKGYEYVWVDTCCINKQDFTELTEAINSMFKLYANAGICIAYLSDIGTGESSIKDSLWFTRGWTLQELIAPKEVEFFDGDWNFIGTRAELCNDIHMHTRIDRGVLLHETSSNGTVEGLLAEIPVARRMSWASGRTTTREEDMAYSLLGIFNINMPLLYGEGKEAFLRLQTEIIKETNDMTLFAWTSCPASPGQQSPPRYRGVLAASPKEFERSGNFLLTRDIRYNPEYTMTNKGLRIVTEISMNGDMMQFLKLGCHRDGYDSGKSLGIRLEDHGGGVFLRSQPSKLFEVDNELRSEAMTLFIKKHTYSEAEPLVVAKYNQSFREAYQFHINWRSIQQTRVVPESMWNQQKRMFITKGLESFEGFVQFRMQRERHTQQFVVACGFTSPGKEWICMASSNGRNREIYNAAINGNLNKMRALAIQANQGGNAALGRLRTRMARMQTHHQEAELVFHIYLGEADDPVCLVM